MKENYSKEPDEFDLGIRKLINKIKKYSLTVEIILILGAVVGYFMNLDKITSGEVILIISLIFLVILNFITALGQFEFDYSKVNSVKNSVFVKYLSFWSKSIIVFWIILEFFEFNKDYTKLIVGAVLLAVSVIIAIINLLRKNKSEIFSIKEISRNLVYLAVVIYILY